MPVKDYEPVPSNVRIGAHPLHPMLIAFPIATLVLAAVADILFFVTVDPMWAWAAYCLLVVGLVSGVAAAIPGLVDFFTIRRARDQRHGWYHFLLNGTVLCLAVINIVMRAGDPKVAVPAAGLVVSLLTAGLLTISGWFGWELTFRHKIGVSTAQPSTSSVAREPLEEHLEVPPPLGAPGYRERPAQPSRERRPPTTH